MPLDDDDLAKVKTLFTEGLSTFQKDTLPGLIRTGVQAGMQGVPSKEDITTIVTEAVKAKTADPDPKTPDPKNKPKGDEDPALVAMREEMAQMKARGEAAEQRAKAAEEASKNERLRNGVRDALIAKGCAADHVDAALKVINLESFSLSEAGAVQFTRPGEFGGTETVDAAEGATAFLATDTGKIFLPPSNVEGNGEGPTETGVDANNVGDPMGILQNALGALMDPGASGATY